MTSRTQRTCPGCHQKMDFREQGKCPHCQLELPTRFRTCPKCNHVFTRSKNAGKKRYCPNCQVEIYYPQGKKLKGQTILAIDKDTCLKIVQTVEAFIAKQGDTVFAFEGPSHAEELTYAYSLLDRSKTYFRKQPDDYGVDPHEFTLELVRYMLSKWKGNLNSMRQMLNFAGGYANELFKQKKLNAQNNRAMKSTFVDYRVYETEWN